MGIGGRANTALATLRPPPFPTPSRREVTVWSVGAAWLVKQLEGVGVESRGGGLAGTALAHPPR